MLTGNGRCNFTNNRTIPEIVECFGKKGKFLYSALTKFSNQDLISFFEERGVKTKVERGQRVFPQSDKSQTILDCLLRELKRNKVKVIYNFRVTKIKRESDRFALLSEKKEPIRAKRIVLSTGGKSYPQTGSTGDGYRLAKGLGHKIIPLKPALDKNQLKKEFFGKFIKCLKSNFKAC